jgi:hypothetical protein
MGIISQQKQLIPCITYVKLIQAHSILMALLILNFLNITRLTFLMTLSTCQMFWTHKCK